jgi:hypothetical protein
VRAVTERDEGSGAPAAVAFPSEESLVRTVQQNRRGTNVARVVSSSVSGCATLLFAGLTVAVAVAALSKGSLPAAAAALIPAAMTAGFGFLTWRWARGLPPSKQLASNEMERDELDP